MGKVNNNEQQIEYLIAELSECREDERSSQNQILQTVAAGGTLLAVVFGSSFFEITDKARSYLFILSILVFYVSMANIITLGINNVLRFHYIRDIEDRLSEFIGEDTYKAFIGWMSLSSSINTRNIAHILSSKYTFLSYFCYSFMTVSAILFCGILTFLQYYFMDYKSNWIIFIMTFHIIFTVMSIFVFVWISFKAKDMYKLSYKLALSNRTNRIKTNSLFTGEYLANKPRSKRVINDKIKKAVVYYIFPKTKDLQKSFIVIIGSLIGNILQYGLNFELRCILNTVITWIVIELLMYQARYQLNDIRGIDEDVNEDKIGRLPIYIGHKRSIIISLTVILFRLLTAIVLIIFWGNDMRVSLAVGMICIAVITIMYEFVRTNNKVIGIILMVGVGYPIRFFIGFSAAYTIMLNDLYSKLYSLIKDVFTGLYAAISSLPTKSFERGFGWIPMILLLISYFFMGIFSAIIPWTYEAFHHTYNKKAVNKPHLTYLFNMAKDSYKKCVNDIGYNAEDRLFPLRDKGKLSQFWNWSYVLSIIFISILRLYYCCSIGIILFEIFIISIAVMICYSSHTQIIKLTVLFCILVVLLAIYVGIYYESPGFFVFASINQIAAMLIYYILRYSFSPSYNFIVELRKFLNKILVIIIGKDAAKYLIYKGE